VQFLAFCCHHLYIYSVFHFVLFLCFDVCSVFIRNGGNIMQQFYTSIHWKSFHWAKSYTKNSCIFTQLIIYLLYVCTTATLYVAWNNNNNNKNCKKTLSFKPIHLQFAGTERKKYICLFILFHLYIYLAFLRKFNFIWIKICIKNVNKPATGLSLWLYSRQQPSVGAFDCKSYYFSFRTINADYDLCV
jgi:hypothetical protein